MSDQPVVSSIAQQKESLKKTQSGSRRYENVSGEAITKRESKRYVNIDELPKAKDGAEKDPPSGKTPPGEAQSHTYINLPPLTTTSGSPGKERQLKSQQSEPCLKAENGYDVLRPIKQISAPPHLKSNFLIPEVKQCPQCKELSEIVSLWQLGASGLARNYSRILAQLNKARDATMCLESKMKQRAGIETSMLNSVLETSVGENSPKPIKRHSMLETSSLPPSVVADSNLANRMYPHDDETQCELPPQYAKYLTELNTHLGNAIDLCQGLAAACFKKDQANDLSAIKGKRHVQRLSSQPLKAVTSPAPTGLFRPSLVSISETNPSSTLDRINRHYRRPSAPVSLKHSNGLESESDTESGSESETLERIQGQLETTEKEQHQTLASRVSSDGTTPQSAAADSSPVLQPYRSHMMSLIQADQRTKNVFLESGGLEGSGREKPESLTGSIESIERSSTFSDGDVKQVMSKIASLEEERLKLLETIDSLQSDNQQVRLSLYETLGDLENKDLQLTLAMQDLTIATDEMQRAARMRQELDRFSRERNILLEKLSNLEDESSAVKVSLIQLLQQKSATNKTLALENSRLNQKVKRISMEGNPSPTGTFRRTSKGEGDNVSLNSHISAADTELHEAYIGLEDVGCFVHKQGFLKKQGGKVKNWKKRLFVLDSDGLSYYKTEQPIQRIPLSRVERVQITHGRTIFPHMFEVHTRERIYYLSALTGDEMQSWVGMLQTLLQYNRTRQPTREGGTQLNRSVSARNKHVVQSEASALPQRPRSDASLDMKVAFQQLHQQQHQQLELDTDTDTDVVDGKTEYSKSVPVSRGGFVDEEAITTGSLNITQPKDH